MHVCRLSFSPSRRSLEQLQVAIAFASLLNTNSAEVSTAISSGTCPRASPLPLSTVRSPARGASGHGVPPYDNKQKRLDTVSVSSRSVSPRGSAQPTGRLHAPQFPIGRSSPLREALARWCFLQRTRHSRPRRRQWRRLTCVQQKGVLHAVQIAGADDLAGVGDVFH